MDEMLKELQALIDKYKDGTPDGVSDEQAEKDAERMSQLTAEIEKRTAADAAARESRAARIAAARSAIDNSTALFSDVTRDTIPGQYELVRHKAIAKGDAAKTAEGATPTDEEQNEFDRITLTGDEIKKTVKLSRKMMIQSLDSFRTYINREVSARCGVAGDKIVLAKLVDGALGMAAGNKISVAKAGTLTKADMMKALSLLKTYGNPAAKGVRIYANQSTIWNKIAAIEDATKRSYFIDREGPHLRQHREA